MQLRFSGCVFLCGGGMGLIGKNTILEKNYFRKCAKYVQNRGFGAIALCFLL